MTDAAPLHTRPGPTLLPPSKRCPVRYFAGGRIVGLTAHAQQRCLERIEAAAAAFLRGCPAPSGDAAIRECLLHDRLAYGPGHLALPLGVRAGVPPAAARVPPAEGSRAESSWRIHAGCVASDRALLGF